MTRVLQLTDSWQKAKTKNFIQSRLQSAHYPNKRNYRVPHLTRNYNTVEQNIFAVAKLNKTISHIDQTPEKTNGISFNSTSLDEGFYEFPSNSKTKQENQEVINKLQQQFSIFKQNQKKFKLNTRSVASRNSSMNMTSISANDNYLVNQKTVLQNGVKFPYQLLLINQQRKKILSSMINTTENTLITISNADDLDEIKKQDSIVYQNEGMYGFFIQVRSSQNEKKRKELLSRGFMTNAMYSLMALSRKSQQNVKTKYQTLLPRDSRFYAL